VLFTLIRTFGGGEPGVKALAESAAELDHPGYLVDDLKGAPLFYLFPARLAGPQTTCWVRASADSLLGPAILAIDTPRSPWDPATSIQRAYGLARENFRTTIGAPRLVCYSYPRIGVRVPLGVGDSVIYDAWSFEEVPLEPGENRFGAWSYLSTVVEPNADVRLAMWRADDERLTHSLDAHSLAGAGAEGEQPDPTAPGVTLGKVRYSSQSEAHECFALYAQKNNRFCAMASAQMILDFYRYSYSQDAIATEMGTPDDGITLTQYEQQRAAYESLSGNGLVATLDRAPCWQRAKAEIDANRPLKSGIIRHARVCTGWLEEPETGVGARPRQWLRLHDPLPAHADLLKGGTTTWEAWTEHTHTNFILVRHR
jgi:hypothetical protein